MKKKTKKVLSVIFVILLLILLFSGYKLFTMMHEYVNSRRVYNSLSSQYVVEKAKDEQQPVPEDAHEEGFTEFSPITVDFDALKADAPDIIGWIYCKDTIINYPVVQADDNDYYLHRFADGTYNPGGSIFADFRCRPFEGQNTVLYGHHMNDGSMFASICGYNTQVYYDSHPFLYLNTPEHNYKLEVFSAYITRPDSRSYTIDFFGTDEYTAFLNKITSDSVISTGVSVTENDRIVTLSTCTYEYDDARFVVHCKLTEIG